MRKSILMYSLLALSYFVFSTLPLTEVSAQIITLTLGDKQKTTRSNNFPDPVVFTLNTGGSSITGQINAIGDVQISKDETMNFTKQIGNILPNGTNTVYVKANSDALYETCEVQASVYSQSEWHRVSFTGTITDVLYFSADTTTRSIDKGATIGAPVGAAVSATHWSFADGAPALPDGAAAVNLVYSLDPDHGLFSIDSNGQLKAKRDLGTNDIGSYTVTVTVKDEITKSDNTKETRSSDTITVTITVTDVDEPPPIDNTPPVDNTPPINNTPPPRNINAGTTQTLTVRRVNSRTVTLSWDIPTALNAQTIAYEYSTNGGQTWTSTNSTNTSITITGDGFGDLPTTQFKIRAMNQNTDGTESFVIISASATQPRRILLRPRECPLGWTRGSVFGNTKKALIYELKVEADPTNTASIYQLKSLAIYVHPDEGLETLDGWTLKVGTLYNQFGKEFKLTAENSVIDEYDFAHIENPEETPIPMGMLGYIGQSLPSFDYRLYDAGGVRVDFGISCYKGGGLTWRLWNTADPRLLRVLPLEKSEEALSGQMENLDWRTPFFRSEWTAAIMPDLPDAPAAPSQIKGNIVGTWADLKKQ